MIENVTCNLYSWIRFGINNYFKTESTQSFYGKEKVSNINFCLRSRNTLSEFSIKEAFINKQLNFF